MSTKYKVQQGDCISSIAFECGFFPATVWDFAGNSDLKKLRKDMHVLMPGDIVEVPDLKEKTVSVHAGKRHRFRRRGVPEELQFQFFDELNEPLADCACIVDIDGNVECTKTDHDGRIRLKIVPNAQKARIRFESSGVEWAGLEFDVEIGGIDPVTEDSGVRQRLGNLGFLRDGIELVDAIRSFQCKEKLTVAGVVNDETRSKLGEKSTL